MSRSRPPAYATGEVPPPAEARARDRSAAAVDAATAADRDRWVDRLRVGSLLVVVLGHRLMVAITPTAGS